MISSLPEGVVFMLLVHESGEVAIGRSCDVTTSERILSGAISRIHAEECDADEHNLLITSKMPKLDVDAFLRSLRN